LGAQIWNCADSNPREAFPDRGVASVGIAARWPSGNPFPGASPVGIRHGKSPTGPSACPCRIAGLLFPAPVFLSAASPDLLALRGSPASNGGRAHRPGRRAPGFPAHSFPVCRLPGNRSSIPPMSPPRHQIRGSIAASISACHAEDPGSHPERRPRRADRSVVPLRLELEFQAPQSMRELQRPMGHPHNRCV
jgi:hypothetical protein